MTKRKTKKAESLIPATEKTEVIPPDLKLKWDGVVAVATAFGTLDKGYFPHSYGTIVKESLKFLAKLHENMVEDCLKHPQSFMIPELKNLKNEGIHENGEKSAEN